MLESDWLTNVLRCGIKKKNWTIIDVQTTWQCQNIFTLQYTEQVHTKGVQFFSGKRATANVVPGSTLDRITVPYHFAKWFLLFQRSHYNRKITKTHNDTGQTNKYSKQKDKIDRSCPCFCHKLTVYYVRKGFKAHTLSFPLSVSPSQTHV